MSLALTKSGAFPLYYPIWYQDKELSCGYLAPQDQIVPVCDYTAISSLADLLRLLHLN